MPPDFNVSTRNKGIDLTALKDDLLRILEARPFRFLTMFGLEALGLEISHGKGPALQATPAGGQGLQANLGLMPLAMATLPLLGIVCAFVAVSSFLGYARKIHLAQTPS